MSENGENVVETFFKTFSGSTSFDKDIEEFHERLSTYIVGQKWVRRPLVLSPAVCARYGWKCLNYNLLECVTCGAKLCTPEPKIDLPDVYKACIEKILKDLKSSHKTHCPWPFTPSPESFVRMFFISKEEALKFFLQRFEPTIKLSSALPQIKYSSVSQLGLNEQHILALCKFAKMTDDDAQKFGTCAVSLAATGWTITRKGDTEEKAHLECKSCQRTVLTGSFNLLSSNLENTSAEASQNENKQTNDVDYSPSSRIKRFKKDDFDPLEEHRPWCLWVGTESKSKFKNGKDCIDVESSEIPGWEIFMKSLLRNVCESEDDKSEVNPTREQIRSVRDLLETWTDPVE